LEGKSSYFILLVIVAFLSITLAFLAIGFFFFYDKGPSKVETVVQAATTTLPAEDDLTLKVLFENKNFNLKKSNEKEIAVINVSASIKHFKVVKEDKLKEADVTAKLDFYNKEIVSDIGTYFQGLTLADVSQPDSRQKCQKELKDRINKILANGDEKASPLVYTVTLEWFYQ
jgi:flagellar basal body-associated protein FliL